MREHVLYAMKVREPSMAWHEQLGMEPAVLQEMRMARMRPTNLSFGSVSSPESFARASCSMMSGARWTMDSPVMEGFTSEEEEDMASVASSGRLLEAEAEVSMDPA